MTYLPRRDARTGAANSEFLRKQQEHREFVKQSVAQAPWPGCSSAQGSAVYGLLNNQQISHFPGKKIIIISEQ